MELRYATTQHASELSQFARRAFYDSYAWYNTEQDMADYLNSNFTNDKLRAEINNTQTIFILAYDTDELCGYIKLTWNSRPDVPTTTEKQLEIARLYAAKKQIGKGVGKALMQAAVAFAQQHDATIIWLDVWKENKRAIEFYTKWGFAIVSDWTFMLGNDKQKDYIMVKQLINL